MKNLRNVLILALGCCYLPAASVSAQAPQLGKASVKQVVAAMTLEEKAKVSHRGKALMELKNEFEKILQWLNRRFDEERIARGAHDICQR